MKKAGEIFSVLFDERFMKKAEGVSKFFDSWADITAKNGIAAASAHSRIKDIDRGIMLVETDHPGWKQILQTKQKKILNDYCRLFPDLGISGISFMLGKGEPVSENKYEAADEPPFIEEPMPLERTFHIVESAARGLDVIKDEDFKETLKRLEQDIIARENSSKKSQKKIKDS